MNCWAGILGNRIIGPTFFEGALNGPRYLEFLQEELPQLIQDAGVPEDIQDAHWFMQDGAPPHWARAVRDHLDQVRCSSRAIDFLASASPNVCFCLARFIHSGGLAVEGLWRGRLAHPT